VWSLPKFERLHIGGWGMTFYKQHCYIFQVTQKKIKRLTIPGIKINCTHTSEDANQFSDCRRTNSCPILNERVCEVIPHLWLCLPSTCMFLDYHEGRVRPVQKSRNSIKNNRKVKKCKCHV